MKHMRYHDYREFNEGIIMLRLLLTDNEADLELRYNIFAGDTETTRLKARVSLDLETAISSTCIHLY